jgi:hypothetical protein
MSIRHGGGETTIGVRDFRRSPEPAASAENKKARKSLNLRAIF